MTEQQLARISALAQKSRTPDGLTQAERDEQAALRAEYVAAMKASLKRQLDSTVVVQPDGTRKKLKQKGAQ